MDAQLDELIGFLRDPKVEVRQVAVQHVASFTDPSAGATAYFHKRGPTVIPDCMALTQDASLSTSHDAFRALINLSGDESLRPIMNDDSFLIYVLAIITSPSNPLADLGCMLLSNLTKEDTIALKLIDVSTASGVEGITSSTRVLDQLTDIFLKGVDKSFNENCDYNFLASVFANLTLHAAGRAYFLTPAKEDGLAPITKLMCFTEHPNIIRRGGVVSAMKNCCFEQKDHINLLNESGLNLLPYFLLPLVTAEEFDEADQDGLPEELQFLDEGKSIEKDEALLRSHIEALLLLASTREAREILRARRAYRVLQRLHLALDDEPTQELIDRVVQLLIRDEEGATVEEIPSAKAAVTVDDGIEEI